MPVENLPGERIESLVDELEGIIEEARPPFGKGAQQKTIETDVLLQHPRRDSHELSRGVAEVAPHPQGA